VDVRVRLLETGQYLQSGGTWTTTPTDYSTRSTATYASVDTDFTVDAFSTTLRHSLTLQIEILEDTGVGYADGFRIWPHINFSSVHGHNLANDLTVELQSSTNNFSSENTEATFTVARPSFYTSLSTLIDRRYWRLDAIGTNYEPLSYGLWVLSQRRTLTRDHRWGEVTRFQQPQIRDISGLTGQVRARSLTMDEARRWTADYQALTTAQRDEVHKELMVRSKWGEDPVIVVPLSTEDVVIHGRVENAWEYTRDPATIWPMEIKVMEDAYAISVA
jgi:hypothetical protein